MGGYTHAATGSRKLACVNGMLSNTARGAAILLAAVEAVMADMTLTPTSVAATTLSGMGASRGCSADALGAQIRTLLGRLVWRGAGTRSHTRR